MNLANLRKLSAMANPKKYVPKINDSVRVKGKAEPAWGGNSFAPAINCKREN
jgi:hypothetical protein